MADRQPFNGLTDAEIEHLVEKVSERVIQNFYTEVGRRTVRGFLWAVGVIVVSILAVLGFTGKLKGGV